MSKNLQNSAYNQGYAAGYRAGLADGMAGKIGAEAEEELLQLPLKLLDLSARTRNALTGYGCVRIGDVAQIQEEKIRCIRNLGQKGLNEVAWALREQGLLHTDWNAFLTEVLVTDIE